MPTLGREIPAADIANIYYEIKDVCQGVPPRVFIEKIFIMPTDGKSGMMTYAQGAGRLEMIALWKWPTHLVSPREWTKVIHDGIARDLKPKEKSLRIFMGCYPELYMKGSDFWPSRRNRPHDGLIDAILIADYGRRKFAAE